MAKKPSPAELKKQGVELAATFAAMRKAEHNFALQLGKEGIVFVADKRKAADVLWRKAKADGGSSKGVMGKCIMNGKVIELDCEDPDKAPPGIQRMAKAHFSARGQSAKIIFKGEEDPDAEGEGTEEETAAAEGGGGGGDAAAAPEGGDGAAPAEDAGAPAGGESDLDALKREYGEIEPDVEAAVGSDSSDLSKKVGGLKKMFESQLEANPKKARTIMGMIQTALQAAKDAGELPEAGAGGGAAADPAAVEARRAKIAELEKSVDDLLAEFA